MPFPAGSLQDVEAWAKAEFPVYFAATTDLVHQIPIEKSLFDGELVAGRVLLHPILVHTLGIGCATNTNLGVYACLNGQNDVELFKETEFDLPGKLCYYTNPIKDIAEVELDQPWSCSIETGHTDALNRLETLIMYSFLRHGETDAVVWKLGFFKTHFRAACRDVARATGAVNEADEMHMNDNDILPEETPPDLIADTDVPGLPNDPAANSIFNNHVNAMDESYHDFKTGMLRELGAMRMIDRNNMLQLQAQNQDLERRLALSEEGRMKSEKEREAAEAKAKTTTYEAASWKMQYEVLKGTLQGALAQRF